MYYSCGLTDIPQCKFTEPTYICIAESDRPEGRFEKYPEPILTPDKNSRFFNLSCGCTKVYKLKDGYAAFQNGLYNDKGTDKSAIQLLKSRDGVHFEFVKAVLEPQLCGDSKWMAQFVYASHLIRYKGKLRLYFNARDTAFILTGREHI